MHYISYENVRVGYKEHIVTYKTPVEWLTDNLYNNPGIILLHSFKLTDEEYNAIIQDGIIRHE